MIDRQNPQLTRLVELVLAGRKYRNIDEAFVRRIGAQELAHQKNLKEAVKATRNKLHQVGAVYIDGEFPYASWLIELEQAAQSGDAARFRQVCAGIMGHHASMRERLPILEQFYATTLAEIRPTIKSVLDIACGLHPLALPWMGLPEDVTYYGYDIFQDMAEFLTKFLTIARVQGYVRTRDVIQCSPTERVDVAFVLKALPCLEQVDKSASLHLLRSLNAKHLLISFPIQSLGGRKRGMLTGYEARFNALIVDQGWSVRRYEFATELAFLISK